MKNKFHFKRFLRMVVMIAILCFVGFVCRELYDGVRNTFTQGFFSFLPTGLIIFILLTILSIFDCWQRIPIENEELDELEEL